MKELMRAAGLALSCFYSKPLENTPKLDPELPSLFLKLKYALNVPNYKFRKQNTIFLLLPGHRKCALYENINKQSRFNTKEEFILNKDMSAIDELRNIKSDNSKEIIKWINKMVTKDTTDKQLSELIMKLQLVCQDMDSSVDRSFWNVLNDIQNESLLLQRDLNNIKQDVHKLQNKNNDTLKQLSVMHDVKSRMNMCIESLSEIHNWQTKLDRITKLFEEKEHLDEISVELKNMKQRVQMLKENMPDLYVQRWQILENLSNDLETSVRPRLIESIEEHDYRLFRHYSTVLINIGKEAEIEKSYLISRLETLKELTLHFSHSSQSAPERSLFHFTFSFF
ncbi:hypothetical protein RFI_27769 [Reticulomyxa filosa]|uniref:Conserved oligomeric Golgi complex subunit 7 n=1 Tax=Reticulomyxa filosa TaxID=46433 RepID=X6M6I9_RETFI|nr:hypothetical protein RFI_27769 [Reticulomyxa filosa]|eukprot:ETO09608.1 hypothetical protein RFI_27769 [Reticulomyxa filosa]